MKLVHGSSLDDPELLHQIVLQELKVRGIEVKLETPKPAKKSFVPFSTPATPGASTPHAGRLFGRRLSELSKLLVSLDESQEIDVMVPKLIVSACKYIEENVEIEGIYRLSGSAARQKAMRKEMDCHDTDFKEMSPSPSVLDVAALLKQFLRELPLPVVPRIFHLVLAASFTSPASIRLENLLLCLLLLPSDHLAALSFLLRHLHTVAKSSSLNKMTATNLAIVLTPNLLPVQDHGPATLTNANAAKVDKKVVESNNQRLKLHTEMLEVMILNSDNVGFVSQIIIERYNSCLSIQSYSVTSQSEDNLDDDNAVGPSRRKTKKKQHIRRRSGSLSRVLSSMGKGLKKALKQDSATPGSKIESIHSTPLPAFGGTPDFPSPRGGNSKRKAHGEHELSPSNKAQKRTFESTFTPKMRTRTFSVKRFKRKKSEGKFKPFHIKETFTSYNEVKVTPRKTSGVKINSNNSSPEVRKIQTRSATAANTPNTTLTREEGMDISLKTNEELTDSASNEDFEEQYAEVKAQYLELEQEIEDLERNAAEDAVNERFEAACAAGNLARESRETARQMARVRRSSSSERKPRSPSQRRIGVIRRRSREREQRAGVKTGGSPDRAENTAPNCKPCLTPLNLDKPAFRTKLQRGQPNATSSGLEKPLPSPVMDSATGKARIKMSFKEREKPKVKVQERSPARTKQSPCQRKMRSTEKKKLSHGDSITSLKNEINDMIEKSFGDENKAASMDDEEEVFDNSMDMIKADCGVNDLSSKIENISFKNPSSPPKSLAVDDDLFVQNSPVTRSQMRRVSDGFQFARPDDVPMTDKVDTLRRQSSAFEFRSKFANQEPTYENLLSRDCAARGSLRRRNSSVRDLVQKIETETRKRSVGGGESSRVSSRGSIGSNSSINAKTNVAPVAPVTRAVPDIKVETSKLAIKKPLRISEDDKEDFTDGWVDASEFFKNVTQVEAPQCGRSSIVKIRTQNQGRVRDIGTKFNQPGFTPVRVSAASRRLSARMGTSVSVASTPGQVRPQPKMSATLTSLPPMGPSATPGSRRQTLTGIRTTVNTSSVTKRPAASANYANPTISSNNKVRDKSPNNLEVSTARTARSKSPGIKSPRNVKVERKNSNTSTRDIKKVERSSSSGSKPRKNRVRRNKSDADNRSKRREDRRYLTIGYPGEMRSPLKERQNTLQANVRRCESDRTPSRPCYSDNRAVTRAQLSSEMEVENMVDYENIAVTSVVRKHSLKSDMLMSPKPKGYQPSPAPNKQVKRTASERSTPKTAHYNRSSRTPMMSLEEHRRINMELIKKVTMDSTPRRSPRFSMM